MTTFDFDYDYLLRKEEERKRNAAQNSALVSQVVANQNAAEAPKPTVISTGPRVPDPGLSDEIEDTLFQLPETAPAPEPRKKTWRDTAFGKILMGDRAVEPQGGTAQAQYEDFLGKPRPRAGLLQVAAGAFANAAANSGRRAGQPMDFSTGDDILFGDWQRQGSQLKEAAQQELGQNRVDAIQTAADARIAEVERRANDELAKLGQRQREMEQKRELDIQKQTETTLRDLAKAGFDPQVIEPASLSQYDPNEWVPRELPDGQLAIVRRNARVQMEKGAPRQQLQEMIGLQLAERLAETLATRERMNSADNATTLQRQREADAAALQRVLEMVQGQKDRAQQNDGAAMLLNLLGGAPAGGGPPAGGGGGPDVPDPRLQQLPKGKPVRMRDGSIQVFEGVDPQGNPIFRKPRPGEFK